MKKADIETFFATLAALDPAPKSDLAYGNTYQLLVAVVLSAQATDAGVNKATARLFEQVRTPAQMLALGEDALRSHIRTIGLFNAKAANVIALSAILERDHGGIVPEDRAALEALPGVGRKTANVVLNIAFGWPVIAVDTHIFRVANRTGLATGTSTDKISTLLERRTPAAYRLHAHHWLILLGRYICKARTPECWRCPVERLCGYRDKTVEPQARRPVRTRSPATHGKD